MLSTSMEIGTASQPVADLESIFQQYHRMVYRTAFRVAGNAADAEDVLQTVFLRLSSRDFIAHPLQHPEAYLRRAAANAAVDLIRQRKSVNAAAEGVLELQHAPPGDTPDHRLWVKQTAAWLREAIGGMSEQSAEIFTLRFFDGRSNAEIAEMVGSTVNSVAVTLHRSRERLKDQFRQLLGGNHE